MYRGGFPTSFGLAFCQTGTTKDVEEPQRPSSAVAQLRRVDRNADIALPTVPAGALLRSCVANGEGCLETVEYLHLNPVRRGPVKPAEEWKWSGSVGPWACLGLRPTQGAALRRLIACVCRLFRSSLVTKEGWMQTNQRADGGWRLTACRPDLIGISRLTRHPAWRDCRPMRTPASEGRSRRQSRSTATCSSDGHRIGGEETNGVTSRDCSLLRSFVSDDKMLSDAAKPA